MDPTRVLRQKEDGARSAALDHGLSLARAANAHVKVLAGSVKLDLPSGRSSAVGAGLSAAENRRLRDLAARIADQSRADAALAGVICETEAVASGAACRTETDGGDPLDDA
jgi:hypothetical protein